MFFYMNPRIEELKIAILPILKRAGVKRSAVFGSIARGEDAETSDLDLLVELGDGKSLLDVVALQQELEDRLRKRVDVVEYSALKPRLREAILSEQIPLS